MNKIISIKGSKTMPSKCIKKAFFMKNNLTITKSLFFKLSVLNSVTFLETQSIPKKHFVKELLILYI